MDCDVVVGFIMVLLGLFALFFGLKDAPSWFVKFVLSSLIALILFTIGSALIVGEER